MYKWRVKTGLNANSGWGWGWGGVTWRIWIGRNVRDMEYSRMTGGMAG